MISRAYSFTFKKGAKEMGNVFPRVAVRGGFLLRCAISCMAYRSAFKGILCVLAMAPLMAAASPPGEDASLPPCFTQNGREVLVARATPELLRQAYVKLAFSMTDAGVPVVLLDVSTLMTYPVQFRNFVYLH